MELSFSQTEQANDAGVTDQIYVETLGGFRVFRYGEEIPSSQWQREKALHLFQYLITVRNNTARQHKERIVEQLWPDLDTKRSDRDFKVALNAVYKALEPERKARTESRYIKRSDLAYEIDLEQVRLDVVEFEALIERGNQQLAESQRQSVHSFRKALSFYKGDYLPERRYEDWAYSERERLQVLALNLMTTLARLVLAEHPLESIHLTQRVLTIDPIWEDAYRIQMRAYMRRGNRPMAIRTYQQCVETLRDELAIEPLPETTQLYCDIITGA